MPERLSNGTRRSIARANGAASTHAPHRRLGYGLLAAAGLGFIPSGVALTALSWRATAGPYQVGQAYPYGGPMEAWQVAMGFAFMAFGVLFAAGVWALARLRSRRLWWALVAAYALVWFPHAFMGAAFFLYDPGLASLGPWVVALPFILVWTIALAIGFAVAWRDSAAPAGSAPCSP